MIKNYNHIITLVSSGDNIDQKHCYSLKDVFITKSIITSAGSIILKSYIPDYNSDVYQILLDNNYTLLSKDLCDSFACGSESNTSYFGCSTYEHRIGGSSGGTALNVKLKNVNFGIASCTGGSIETPSICNNILGYKATRETISRYGLISFSQTLDSVGIMVDNSIQGLDTLHDIMILLNKRMRDINFRRYLTDYDTKLEAEWITEAELVNVLGFNDVSIVDMYQVIAYSELYSNLQRYEVSKYSSDFKNLEMNVRLRFNLGKQYIKQGYYDKYRRLIDRYRLMDINKIYFIKSEEKKERAHSDITAMYANIYNLPRFTIKLDNTYYSVIGPRFYDLDILSYIKTLFN